MPWNKIIEEKDPVADDIVPRNVCIRGFCMQLHHTSKHDVEPKLRVAQKRSDLNLPVGKHALNLKKKKSRKHVPK